MEKEIYLNEISNAKMVAHRLGYQMTDYPENSLDVIKTIFASKELLDACYGFEFDICFTKDHIPVVIHDKYIDDITSSRGFINEYTLAHLFPRHGQEFTSKSFKDIMSEMKSIYKNKSNFK